MSNMILLAFCLIAGMGLRKTGRFPENFSAALNGFIIHLSLPALALYHIHNLNMTRELVFTGAMAWVLFGFGFVFFYFVGKFLKLDTVTIGALMLVGGLGNTSFVGLPMIEAYFGKEWLGVGIVADLVGSFFVLSTLGILVANVYSSGAVDPKSIIKKVLMFPPFQALVIAFLLKPVVFPGWLDHLLLQLGATLTPLALVSVGYQLRLSQLKGELKPLAVGLLFKLILGPAVVMGLFIGLLHGDGTVMKVTIFEAAMGPMITAGIVATEHKLNPTLVSLMLGIGIPLSFLTLPVWFWILNNF